ncbi:MAG TPA: hypothetical protein PLH19_09355 [Anaerolineae bacterium]|nr:hypothetical protein [Anaerolineae bacterium]HQH38724.1 hypothetical protein [Anaerolineae bacterium]
MPNRAASQHIRATTLNQRTRLCSYWRAFLFVPILLGMLSACERATATLSPTSTPAAVIVKDEFSPPHAAWARFDTAESAVYAQEGELYLEDRGKGVAVYAPFAGKTYADVDIAVQVRHVQGTVNNWMGVICRQQDKNNYYLLAISADGYSLILLVENGLSVPLAGPQSTAGIRIGKARNNLEARCQGEALTLRVNDALVLTASDSVLQEAGGVALFADAVERGETAVVAFDNFTLSQP